MRGIGGCSREGRENVELREKGREQRRCKSEAEERGSYDGKTQWQVGRLGRKGGRL